MMLIRMTLSAAALSVVAAAASAQGVIATLDWSEGTKNMIRGGAYQCAVGEDATIVLVGEDAAMQRVPLEYYVPEAASSNPAVVRAAATSYPHMINIRCVKDGEAWVTAETRGLQAVFPVLVGSARRQAGMTTTAPAPVGPKVTQGAPQATSRGQAAAPSNAQVNQAVDAAKAVLGIFGRRP